MPKTDNLIVEEVLLKIQQRLELLQKRICKPPYSAPELKQDKIRKYFIERAVQLGEAALHIRTLPVPLFVLSRVICEDTLYMLWVSHSRKNAEKYHKTVIAEELKYTKHLAKAGRVRIVVSDQDATVKMLEKLSAFKDERTAGDVASELGMSKLYDIFYRWNSLYVHGNTFDLESRNPKQSPAIPLNDIQAFLWVIFEAADRASGALTSQEVLIRLGLSTIGGRNSKPQKSNVL